MNHRMVWSLAGVVGLGLLIVAVSALPAQRAAENKAALPMPGRFVVAHATAVRVIILDTVTGQVYKADGADFKPISDLPRVSETIPPPFVRPPASKDAYIKDKDKRDKDARDK